jgi:hypothetical protein
MGRSNRRPKKPGDPAVQKQQEAKRRLRRGNPKRRKNTKFKV